MLRIVEERLNRADIIVLSQRKLSLGRAVVTASLEEVAAFQPQIAIISAASNSRVEMVEALPEKIAGVIIEKPLAKSYQEGRQVAEILESRGTVSQVGYNLRFSESLRVFRTAILERKMGALVSVRAETGQYLPDWRPGRDYQNTVSARRDLGGGVLRELSHEADYLQWIFGPIDWVCAWTGHQSRLEIDVEDVAHITCGFRVLQGSNPLVGQVNLDLVRRDNVRTITAICEEGSIQWDGVRMQVRLFDAADSEWRLAYSEEDQEVSTYELAWDSFCDALANSVPPAVTLDDGLNALGVITAIEASHKAGGLKTRVRYRGDTE